MLIPFGILAAAGSFYSQYELIATQLADGVSSVSFTSIPQNYAALQVRFTAKTNGSAQDITVQMNGALTNNASWRLQGAGTTVSAAASGTTGGAALTSAATASTTASAHSAGIIDFANYAATTTSRGKSFKAVYGSADNTALIALGVGYNTGTGGSSPLTSLSFILPSGLLVNSRFSLYGIR